MTNQPDETERINRAALRTLHALERTLRRHIDDLMALDCEDAEAADAIVFEIEAAEAAIANTRGVRQRVMKG